MNKSRKTIFITGAGGFIGKNLCKYLGKRDYHIRAMLRSSHIPEELISKNIEIVRGDITDLKTLIKLTKNIYAVVNLAARKSDENDSFKVNVTGVENLLKACEINKVEKFIQLSTVSAKIAHKGVYGKTKDLADQAVIKSKTNYAILRVSLIYGDKTEGIFAALIKASRLRVVPVFGDGTWISYPIYVDDLSKTIEKIINSKNLRNQIWDIGGNEGITFDVLLRKIAATQNKTPVIIHIPKNLGLIVAKFLSLLLNNPPITVSNILGSTQNVELNIKKYQEDLGVAPLSLDKGLNAALSKTDTALDREAEIIIKYILSSSNIKYTPDETLLNNYSKLIKSKFKNSEDRFSKLVIRNPWLISPVEIFLRIFYTDAIFLKKIYVLAALLECTPITSDWLLPMARSKSDLSLSVFSLTTGILTKYVIALILAPSLFLYAKQRQN